MPNNSRVLAHVRPTRYGTYGIHWENWDRTTYSGPFDTSEEAEERAYDIAKHYGFELTLDTIEV